MAGDGGRKLKLGGLWKTERGGDEKTGYGRPSAEAGWRMGRLERGGDGARAARDEQREIKRGGRSRAQAARELEREKNPWKLEIQNVEFGGKK